MARSPIYVFVLTTLAISASVSGLSAGFFVIELETRAASPSSYAPLWANAVALSIAFYGITRCSAKPDNPFTPAAYRDAIICIMASAIALTVGFFSRGLWR